MNRRFIFDTAPQRIYWETTNACDLACRHCRAEAAPEPNGRELSTAEGSSLLSALARFGSPLPHLVLTGGDPLKRADLFALISYARDLGFAVSVAPSATPLLTESAIAALKNAQVDAISLSLDGSTAERHDGIRGIVGTFERTLRAAAAARAVGLPFQINTLVCGDTEADLRAIHQTALSLGAARWSLFFLVTVGRGDVLRPVSQERADEVLTWAAALAPTKRGDLVVTTTEAPHIRRIAATRSNGASERPSHGAGIRDGNGILFVSNTGEICPSGFLELSCGNVRNDDVVRVYREAPLFKSLRDPSGFGGRCGRCEFRFPCGGSRARAWAAAGDPLAEDPLCSYEPKPVHSEPTRTAQ